MNGMSFNRRGLRTGLLTIAAAGLLLVGCNDDDGPTDPPRDFGTSNVTFLHVNPGREGAVAFFRGDSIRIGTQQTVDYESMFKASVPNGENLRYMVTSLSGQTLATATGSHDSSQITTVVYSGDAVTDDLFIVSTERITTNPGSVAVRFIHAAKDAGARSLHINDSVGAAVAQNLEYKEGNATFISVPIVGTTSFWIVDPTKNTAAIEVPINLAFGSAWTIVFHGARTAIDPDLRWQGSPIADE